MEKNNKLKLGVVAVFAIMALTALAYLPADIIKEEELVMELPTWNALGDYNPGAGAGGFQRIVIKELPVGSSTTPNSNASVAINLTDIDADGTSDEIPHSTKFGVYVFARFNTTQAYSAGNTTWVEAWVRCNITCSNLSLGPIFMNKTHVVNCSTYMWMCFYAEMNSTAEPLLLARDQVADFAAITLEAYY